MVKIYRFRTRCLPYPRLNNRHESSLLSWSPRLKSKLPPKIDFPALNPSLDSNLARLTEIRATDLLDWKKEIKNKEWETMEDNEGCFHLFFFFFFFFPNQTPRFTVVLSRSRVMLSGRASFHALEDLFVGWNESFVHRIERNVFSFGIFRL